MIADIKKSIDRLLVSRLISKNIPFVDVTLQRGFVSRISLSARILGSNEDFFRDSDQLIIGDEPIDRINTICPTVYGTPPFVAIIKDVYLVGGHHPFAVSSEFKLIYEVIENANLLYMGRVESAIKGINFYSKLLLATKLGNKLIKYRATEIQCAVILTNNWTHYGHWLLEHLIKIRYVFEFKLSYDIVPVYILQRDAPEWQYELLGLFDIESSKVIEWGSKPLKVNQLILTSYPEWNFDDYSWIRSYIKSKLNVKSGFKGKRIYLSRDKCTKRKVFNESEVISTLKKFEIEVVYPEHLSVFEQIQLFSDASFVIGPNGSAFANLIFSENPVVVEFHGLEIRRTAFKLSKVMGFNYYPFYCEVMQDSSSKKQGDIIDEYLFVNCEKLEALLLSII